MNHVMRLLAPAKINLHLRVGPPAVDGFHPLLTWMCTVSLFDTLDFSQVDLQTVNAPELVLYCDDPALPCDGTNLIIRAGKLLADAICAEKSARLTTREGGDAFGRECLSPRGNEGSALSRGLRGVGVVLQKRIPTGAGLGGGSSDGATAMLGLNRAWGADLSAERLAELAGQCGSDLPFFFYGQSSICTGRGQIVKPTPPPAVRWGVLVLPKIVMPTPAVYRKFDELRLGNSNVLAEPPDWQAWAKMSADQLLPCLVNDLESPAFALCPELGKLRAAIESLLKRPVRMSGSGSSLFTLFDDRAEAESAAIHISSSLGVSAQPVQIAPDVESQ